MNVYVESASSVATTKKRLKEFFNLPLCVLNANSTHTHKISHKNAIKMNVTKLNRDYSGFSLENTPPILSPLLPPSSSLPRLLREFAHSNFLSSWIKSSSGGVTTATKTQWLIGKLWAALYLANRYDVRIQHFT